MARARNGDDIEILERGNIYFVYRPKVHAEGEEAEVHGLDDVQRTYVVLSPHGKKRYRLIALGRKQLPDIEDHERNWAFVDAVEADPKRIVQAFERETYETETSGTRVQPAGRPAGEGVYAIARHEDHTHLVYALELPDEPGASQRALRVAEEGSYILSVKNPEAPSPPNAGLAEERRADFPKRLQGLFEERRFIPVDPPDFLDHPGAELVLVGADEDVSGELGLDLDPAEETERTAEIFNDLRLTKSQRPVTPLFEGDWA